MNASPAHRLSKPADAEFIDWDMNFPSSEITPLHVWHHSKEIYQHSFPLLYRHQGHRDISGVFFDMPYKEIEKGTFIISFSFFLSGFTYGFDHVGWTCILGWLFWQNIDFSFCALRKQKFQSALPQCRDFVSYSSVWTGNTAIDFSSYL